MADIGLSTISDIFSSLTGKGDITLSYKNLSALFGKLAQDDLVAYPERWGASSTASPTRNISALRSAYNYLVQQGGGTIRFKNYGPYDFGTLSLDDFGLIQGLTIATSRIRVSGDGRTKTRLRFSSAGGGGLFNINTNSGGLPINSSGLDDINFEYLILEDYNTGSCPTGGFPGFIQGIVVKNCGLRHLELHNGKTRNTAGITILGDANDNYTPGTGDLVMDDIWCYADNYAGGLLQDGDWLNSGAHFNRVTALNIHIPNGGMARHGLEFGTAVGDYLIAFCDINMNSQGTDAIASTSAVRSLLVRHNLIRNWNNTGFGINTQPDDPGAGAAFKVYNVDISYNDFISAAGSAACCHGDPSDVDTYRIDNNLFDCLLPIYWSSQKIPKRIFSVQHNKAPRASNLIVTNANGTSNLGPDFQDATTHFLNDHNQVGGTTSKVTDLTTWKKLKSLQYKPGSHNIVTDFSGQIHIPRNFYTFVLGANVAIAGDSALATFTILGAIVEDIVHVRSHSSAPAPDGVFFFGMVTAPDTVKVYGHNNSVGLWNAGNYNILITVDRK